MDLRQFRESLTADEPPPGLSVSLQALWYDAKGDWNRAHELVQDLTAATGAGVHAYLHRKEGDLSNAAYWYRQADGSMPDAPLDAEWESLAARLLRDRT